MEQLPTISVSAERTAIDAFSRSRTLPELRLKLLVSETPRECSLIDLHNACVNSLERQLEVVLEYAEPRSAEVQSFFHPIGRLLDDQLVRFEIWESDIDAKRGTLELLDRKSKNGFDITEESSQPFELIKEVLRDAHGVLIQISEDLLQTLDHFDSQERGQQEPVGGDFLQQMTDQISNHIKQFDPLMGNLFNLVRPVLACQALICQDGPYWHHRQKIHAVRRLEEPVSSEPPISPQHSNTETIRASPIRTPLPKTTVYQKLSGSEGRLLQQPWSKNAEPSADVRQPATLPFPKYHHPSAVSEIEPPRYPQPPEYEYRLLKSHDAIRLVKLWVGNADANDIDCELIEIGPDQSESYEAVSWCWGKEKWDKTIRIHQGGRPFSFNISANLYSALKAFRRPDGSRTLWIDAICIDQHNLYEKNHQVPMMAQIYGKATRVCIWLGDGDDKSKLALDFIKRDVLQLWDIDKLCEDTSKAPKWDALIGLMKRPWFSRRWVVQEIVLAEQALLQCGEEQIEWQEFADAVALFVEVETATHRVSEVMKKDPQFYHIPDFFGDVRSLGATLLVEATSNLSRKTKDGKRELLLSLEYLVSSLSVFNVTEPRDTIFGLLAIAKDASPKAADPDESVSVSPAIQQQLRPWGKRNIAIKTYLVDYKRPFVEVFKDFMVFTIQKSDQATALDILCRPWAPVIKDADDRLLEKLPSWITALDRAAFAMVDLPPAGQSMFRINADPLVGLPNTGQRNYRAAGSRMVTLSQLKFTKRKDFYSLHVEGFVLDKVGKVEEASRAGLIPFKWLVPSGWRNKSKPPPEEFWRTLVADRGRNGRNAPAFYARACHESFKRTIYSEPLNTKQLIDEGRCTIVTEFLRRVQAVIWNRLLMRTEKGRLGLVHETAKEGDLVCILYGCSVPVVLRKFDKTDAQVNEEQAEDELELKRLKKEIVDKIQTAYLARLERIRQKKRVKGKMHPYKVKVNWKRYWDYTRHLAVVALTIYLKVWYQLTLENLILIGIVAFAILLEIFPDILIRRAGQVWLAMARNMPTWMKRTPKATGSGQGRRSNDCYYELIGPCYVHGMMNGEAIQFQNENQIKAEVFDLR